MVEREGYLNDEGHLTDHGLLLGIECWRTEVGLPDLVRDHLSGCTACQKELLDYKLFLDGTAKEWHLGEETRPEKSGVTRYLRWAAVIAFIATLSWLVLYFNNQPTGQRLVNERVLALKASSGLPFWDEMIENELTTRGGDFEMVSPEIDTILLSPKVTFQWKEASDNEVVLEVFTRENENKPDRWTISSQESVLEVPDLKEGLYYWRILTIGPSGRLKRMALGRFYVIEF